MPEPDSLKNAIFFLPGKAGSGPPYVARAALRSSGSPLLIAATISP